MNTRVTRLNEVQYADSEYRLQQLIAEGFVADEQTEETESVEEKPKKAKAKKAEAAEQPAEETEQVGE
jgi:hypothetical protein|nr:MAG TPA: hypothetical protein [Caudoviricetes sp.]